MEATSVWGLLAAVFGCVSGYAVGSSAHRTFVRRRLAACALAESDQDRLAARFRNGFAPFKPLSRWLLGFPVVSRSMRSLTWALAERGVAFPREALLSLVCAMTALIVLVVGLASSSAVCGVAVAACAVAALFGSAHAAHERGMLELREDVPEALRCMSVCFRSGLSLPQTLQQTAHEMDGSLGKAFATASRRLEMGGTPTEALGALRSFDQVPELAFVAVALDVQHQSGGSVVPVLDAARDSIEGELELMRSLRVQTAQAKLSARIVTVMPFLLVALFSLMSPDFLTPFFASVAGMCLLSLALLMQLAGVLLVRRMLKVEVG